MEENTWVIQINEELKSDEPSQHEWARHTIYKVPLYITALNKKAYKPSMVSFGPYHNGEESLKNMEAHKHRALIHFLRRCKKPIELIYHRMDQVVEELRNSYNPLDAIWMQDKLRFLKMMILDGCFLLEILRANDRTLPNDYAENDPIFGEHGKHFVVPIIRRDMLLLENQLPLMVLRILFEVETDADQGEELLINQILEFFRTSSSTKTCGRINNGKYVHVLDVYRKTLIQGRPAKQKPCKHKHDEMEVIRSATELQESGIRFRKSKSTSLRNVSFSGGVLRLPPLLVDDTTEFEFLNLIAFEHLHVGAGNDVSSYVCFMDRIIDTERDVALLHRNGILINNFGSDKAVAKLFNSLSKEVVDLGSQDQLDKVNKCLSKYSKKPLKKWRANLIQTYFRSPWASISLIAAIFLFSLTILQTIYTILQYYPHKM